MFYLSQRVDVPIPHQAKGLVTLTVDVEGNASDWSEMMHDLLTIRHCDKCPKHAAVAVKSRGYCFYLDERDQDSLATFTLLIEIFRKEVQAGGDGGFLCTLSAEYHGFSEPNGSANQSDAACRAC